MVRGVVTSDGLPVSAVAANFLIQYPLAPGQIPVRIKHTLGVHAETAHPLTVDLHQTDIEGYPRCPGPLYQSFSLFPRLRHDRFPRDIQSQRITARLLTLDGAQKVCRE